MNRLPLALAALLVSASGASAQVLYGPAAIRGGTIDGVTITNSNIVGGINATGNVSAATVTTTGGTASRTLANIAADAVSVMSYAGIDPTGAADSSSAINAAAAFACTFTPPREVYFPAGTYLLTAANLTAQCNGQTLRATPGTAILKLSASSTANPALLSIANVSNVTIYGLTLNGNLAGVPSANNVVTVFQASNVVFDHVTWLNTRGIGVIFSTGVSNSGVKDSFFKNVGNYWITTGLTADQKQGIAFCCGTRANNFGNFVVGSTFSAIGIDAISIAGQSDFLASNNIFRNVGGAIQAGIAGGAAIYASGNDSLVITGNNVNVAYGNGIDVIGSPLTTLSGNTVLSAGGSGISYASGAWSSIVGNVTCNNNQSHGGSTLQAGISLNVIVTDTTIGGNTACDTQGSPTQTWGIQEVAGGTYTNTWVDQSNTVSGNVSGPFGGAISTYTPLKIGATVQGLSQTGTAPNQGVALVPTPNGGGYLSASIPDGTTTGGNTPGAGAISFSLTRSSAGHMASAANSALIGGANNLVSGQYAATLGGNWNIASGPGSYALGLFASTNFRPGTISLANGEFVSQGDMQSVDGPTHLQTTSATPATITFMNIGRVGIDIKHGFRGRVYAVARSATDIKEWSCDYLQNSFNGAATVVLIGSSCSSSFASAGASAWTFSLANDSTAGGISLVATGAAATTINWGARAVGLEVGGL